MPVKYPKLPTLQYRGPSVEDAHDQGGSRKRPRATDGEFNEGIIEDILAMGSFTTAKAKHNAHNEDVDMREAPIVEEEENDKRDKQKSGKYSVDQRKAISRARVYGKEKDYYGVLDLDKSCTRDEVSREYRRLVMLIHPLKTKFKDAEKALIRLNNAKDILSDPEAKKKYDKQRKRDNFKGRGINDEEFALNASGSDSVLTSTDDSDAQSEKMELPDRMEFYEKATSAVEKILLDPKHERALSKIEEINRKIGDQNVKEGYDQTEFLIGTSPLVEMGKYARKAQQSLAKNPGDKRAKRTMKHTADQLQTVIRNFSYPSEWFPSEWLDLLTIEVEEEGSHMKFNNDKGRKKGSSSSRSEYTPQEASTSKVKWQPGLTKNGEKILGYIPYTQRLGVYDINTGKSVHPILRAEFVIEKLGRRNPMELITHKELGKKAYEAYLRLPKSQRNDLRWSEWKSADEDPDNFDDDEDERLMAFASKKTDSDYYPMGFGRYRKKDNSKVVMSRTCARYLFGQSEADMEIQDFFSRVRMRIPWNKRHIESSSRKQIGWNKLANQYDSDISTSSSVENSESELEISHRAQDRKGKQAMRNDESSEVISSSDSEDSSSGNSELERGRQEIAKPDRKGKRVARALEDNLSSHRAIAKHKSQPRVKFVESSSDSSTSDSPESEPERRSRQSLIKGDRKGKRKGKGKIDKAYRDKVWREALERARKDLTRDMTRGRNPEFKKLARRAVAASSA